MFGKKDSVVEVFQKELEQIKQQIKNEVISEVGEAIQNLARAIQQISNEVKTMKSSILASQEIAIRSAVQGVTEVNLLGLVNQLKIEIEKFLRNELRFPDSKTISNIINLAVTNAINQIFQQETQILAEFSTKIKKIEDRISKLEERLSSLDELKNKLSNINFKTDTSYFDNKINELEEKLKLLESKIQYIYDVNKELKELIESVKEEKGRENE